jgi:DNA repair protein RecO
MTSQIVRTEGLVLRNLRYGDTSRVATLFTPTLGKISVIGKGVREPRSPFGSSLELFARSEYVVYFRSGRNLQMLKSGDIIDVHRGLQESSFLFVYGCAVIEFLDRMLLEEEPSPPLYILALRVLSRLQTASKPRAREIFRAFQLRAASLLGYGLLLDGCLHCGRSLDEPAPVPSEAEVGDGVWLFRPSEGGALCPNCARAAESGHPLTVRALLRIRSMVSAENRTSRDRQEVPGVRDRGSELFSDVPAAETSLAHEGEPRIGFGVVRPLSEHAETSLAHDSERRKGASLEAELRWAEALDRIVEDFLHFHVERYRGLRSFRSGCP